MYRVFIADDEKLVVRSLKVNVDWDEYGFEVVGEAYNGIDAYERIYEIKPDVVFVDIRMPGMSGLELIKEISRLEWNIQFVVVSGYAEFAYAQKAMNYGAIGYCLKPFDESEIGKLLVKAVGNLRRNKEILEKDILSWVEEQSPEMHDRLEAALQARGFVCSRQRGFKVLMSLGQDTLEFPDSVNSLGFKVGSRKHAYFVDNLEDAGIIACLGNWPGRDITSVGLGGSVHAAEYIREALEEAETAAYQYFITGERDIYRIQKTNEKYTGLMIRQLEEALNSRDIQAILSCLDEIEGRFPEGLYNIKHAFILYNIVLVFLNKLDPEHGVDLLYNYKQLLDLFRQAQDMMKYLKELLEDYLGSPSEYAVEKVKNDYFKMILYYVNQNYCKNMSLQEISRRFVINPSYVSQLFKKETGTNYIDYLTKLRISHACELLKTTNLTVNDISEKTGYNDYFYFTRIFKKETGKTPSQYREQ